MTSHPYTARRPGQALPLLALTLLLGRYSGYRLLELVRFKTMADPAP